MRHKNYALNYIIHDLRLNVKKLIGQLKINLHVVFSGKKRHFWMMKTAFFAHNWGDGIRTQQKSVNSPLPSNVAAKHWKTIDFKWILTLCGWYHKRTRTSIRKKKALLDHPAALFPLTNGRHRSQSEQMFSLGHPAIFFQSIAFPQGARLERLSNRVWFELSVNGKPARSP